MKNIKEIDSDLRGIYLTTKLSDNDIHNHFYAKVTKANIKYMAVYFAIRQCVPALWLNDRDQYLVPSEQWSKDEEFINNCLALTLLHGQNRISCVESSQGPNHWIPFTEQEVDAKESFKSHFMSDYIRGKAQTGQRSQQPTEQDLFAPSTAPQPHDSPVAFSPEAEAVMASGKALWRYYHAQPHALADAALYDIRLHFQGLNDKGKMNAGSPDERYNQLIAQLRQSLRLLAQKIEPKVYEYGFLKR